MVKAGTQRADNNLCLQGHRKSWAQRCDTRKSHYCYFHSVGEKRAAQGPSSEDPAQVLLFTYIHCLRTGNLSRYMRGGSALLISLSAFV